MTKARTAISLACASPMRYCTTGWSFSVVLNPHGTLPMASSMKLSMAPRHTSGDWPWSWCMTTGMCG